MSAGSRLMYESRLMYGGFSGLTSNLRSNHNSWIAKRGGEPGRCQERIGIGTFSMLGGRGLTTAARGSSRGSLPIIDIGAFLESPRLPAEMSLVDAKRHASQGVSQLCDRAACIGSLRLPAFLNMLQRDANILLLVLRLSSTNSTMHDLAHPSIMILSVLHLLFV